MQYLALLLFWAFSMNLHAFENKAEREIARLYQSDHIQGSLLIESLDGKQKYQYNLNHQESFIPASTFKIPNTLIILEEGLIKDPSEIIAWDGVKREYAAWNKDQTLKTAFKVSCVWCYQRYSLKVGSDKYQTYLRKMGYGNHLTGSDITRFWLDGDLRISVKNQVNFLRRLYLDDLPIQKKYMRMLKNVMLSESQSRVKVWSKTGWSGKDGWYVGYLEVNNQIWFFANHIEINQVTDLALRKKLTMEVFKQLNIIKQ